MNKRRRTSIIWTTPDEELIKLVNQSNSLSGVLRAIGISTKGGNSKTLKARLIESGIQIPYPMGLNSCKGRKFPNTHKRTLEEVMVENSTYARGNLKKRLLTEGILKEVCNKCGQLPNWNGEKLVLILDHKNGISNDHRLENLQLLCPNCNSQTATFAGRNKKYDLITEDTLKNNSRSVKDKLKLIFLCSQCGEKRSRQSVNALCKNCYNVSKRKTERPPLEILETEIKELGYSATGRKYNVSDNCIRKWIAQYKNLITLSNNSSSLRSERRNLGAEPSEVANLT